MKKSWYVSRNNTLYGPYNREEALNFIREGYTSEKDLLWNPTEEAWVNATNLATTANEKIMPRGKGFKTFFSSKKKFLFFTSGVAIAVIAMILFFANGLSTTDDEDTGIPMPAIDIEHDSGARFQAPEGTFVGFSQIEINTRDDAPSAYPFERIGPAYEIDGLILTSGLKPVTLAIPMDSDVESPVAMYYSLGEWIRIPSTKTTLESGEVALEVQIDGEPLPWLLTVADAPEEVADTPDLIEGEDFYSSLIRAKQLRITDRKAFVEAMQKIKSFNLDNDNLTNSNNSSISNINFNLGSKAHAIEDDSTSREDFSRAIISFSQARLKLLETTMELEDREKASAIYLEGLYHLLETRNLAQTLDPEEYPELDQPPVWF